jgi:hypothetical protein
MCMSHMCVDMTTHPSVRATCRGHVVFHLLTTGVPSMTKIWVAPESAMESFVLSLKTAPAKARAEEKMLVLQEEQVLDAMIVISLLSICWVGFNQEAALT